MRLGNWQMAVVDWDRLLEVPGRESIVNHARHDGSLKDGEVVFIVSTYLKDASTDSLRTLSSHWMDGNVMMAMVWVPSQSLYFTTPIKALHPICTEKDAIEMELKFGIKL